MCGPYAGCETSVDLVWDTADAGSGGWWWGDYGKGADESFSAVFGPCDWGTSGFGGERSTPAAHTGLFITAAIETCS